MKKIYIIILTVALSYLSFADSEDYSNQNLEGWNFSSKSLILANFTNANLINANFQAATLNYATFADATIKGTNFSSTTSNGFTKEQLYSTKSYNDKDLSRIELGNNNLSGWDFSEQNLSDANFEKATLTNANFTGATIKGSNLTSATSIGFTKEQLYSTKSYNDNDLIGIVLSDVDWLNCDFSEQNLPGAVYYSSGTAYASVTSFNFTDSIIKEATFINSGITKNNCIVQKAIRIRIYRELD